MFKFRTVLTHCQPCLSGSVRKRATNSNSHEKNGQLLCNSQYCTTNQRQSQQAENHPDDFRTRLPLCPPCRAASGAAAGGDRYPPDANEEKHQQRERFVVFSPPVFVCPEPVLANSRVGLNEWCPPQIKCNTCVSDYWVKIIDPK